MMKRIVAAVLVLCGIGITSANGVQQMAIWDFGSNAANYTTEPNAENVIGTPILVLSGGTLDPDGKDGVAYTDAAGVSHIKGQAGAWDDIKVSGVPNADWTVTINTTNWYNIGVRFDYKAWDLNTTTFDLDYRLSDTGAWSKILNNQGITADQAYHGFAYSLLSSVDNQPIVQLKFSDLDRTGNDKFAFDNFELTGTLIPEPATLLLLGLGGLVVMRKKKN